MDNFVACLKVLQYESRKGLSCEDSQGVADRARKGRGFVGLMFEIGYNEETMEPWKVGRVRERESRIVY
jgi:hypothetical protein